MKRCVLFLLTLVVAAAAHAATSVAFVRGQAAQTTYIGWNHPTQASADAFALKGCRAAAKRVGAAAAKCVVGGRYTSLGAGAVVCGKSECTWATGRASKQEAADAAYRGCVDAGHGNCNGTNIDTWIEEVGEVAPARRAPPLPSSAARRRRRPCARRRDATTAPAAARSRTAARCSSRRRIATIRSTANGNGSRTAAKPWQFQNRGQTQVLEQKPRARAQRTISGSSKLTLHGCLYRYQKGYHLDTYAVFQKVEGGLQQVSRDIAFKMVGTPEEWVNKTVLDMVRSIEQGANAQVTHLEGQPDLGNEPGIARLGLR